MFRRAYSDSAKARQLLSNAFERMERAGYQKTDAQRAEIIKAARELNVAPQVAAQAYDSTAPAASKSSGSSAAAPVTETARRRAAQQANTEMFGPPRSEQYQSADFQYDDLPSLAHLHLEEHRDIRKFVRAAAYELPLLAQYRSAYRPAAPAQGETLKFKHFAFLQEPNNPAASKVVLTFTPESTGLPAERLHALKVLAGRRYDSVRNEVRMSANNFETQAQNKRYLAQLYERLVAAARDGEDNFEDVPIDERQALRRAKRSALYPSHHKWPEAWSRPDLAPKPREDIYAVLGARNPAHALAKTN